MDPRISAIIPVYNGRKYLYKAVESVIAQTLPPIELILVDDGSSDDSLSVIEGIEVPFPIIKIWQENRGQSAARNHGAGVAKGDFLAFLDQDDWWYPDHLQKLWQPFKRGDRPRLGWVYSNLDEYDADGKLINKGMLDLLPIPHPKRHLGDLLAYDLFILPSASLIKREAFESVGGFWEALSGYEDDDLFLRLFRAGWENVYIREPLSAWRINKESASYTSRMDKSRRIYAQRLMAEFRDEPWRNRYWVRDYIAPRFFRTAVWRYMSALRQADYAGCREALTDALFYWRHMRRSQKVALGLLLMRSPTLFRLATIVMEYVPHRLRNILISWPSSS